ncbi:phage tail protein [Desulforegula conservatrix]|uniref:phage tail protein n=1 Tax=Desulforegula conservatrix TaxID=153026 RepID=UPI000407E14F|nr:tail fiber protein [Desulforegula conservatrix]
MADPYLGAIHMFAGDFAPHNYALCDGQLLSIQQNQALYSLLGISFGGDAKNNFALPDMRGRITVHRGRISNNSTDWKVGTSAGQEKVSLTEKQMPAHNHGVCVSSANGSSAEPSGSVPAGSTTVNIYTQSVANPVKMADESIQGAGAGQPHENRMPFLAINFIIALYGVYPPRS